LNIKNSTAKNKIAVSLMFFLLRMANRLNAKRMYKRKRGETALCSIILSGAKGLLIPNLVLTAANAYAPATGTTVDGLIIYNTATAGVSPNNVLPVYYYWSATSSKWIFLFFIF
jgi:hypothetical protein